MRRFALVNKIICTHVMHEISFSPTITYVLYLCMPAAVLFPKTTNCKCFSLKTNSKINNNEYRHYREIIVFSFYALRASIYI